MRCARARASACCKVHRARCQSDKRQHATARPPAHARRLPTAQRRERRAPSAAATHKKRVSGELMITAGADSRWSAGAALRAFCARARARSLADKRNEQQVGARAPARADRARADQLASCAGHNNSKRRRRARRQTRARLFVLRVSSIIRPACATSKSTKRHLLVCSPPLLFALLVRLTLAVAAAAAATPLAEAAFAFSALSSAAPNRSQQRQHGGGSGGGDGQQRVRTHAESRRQKTAVRRSSA